MIYNLSGPQQITFQIKNSIVTEGTGTAWAIENEFWEPVQKTTSRLCVAFYDPMLNEGDIAMEQAQQPLFQLSGCHPTTTPINRPRFVSCSRTGHALLTAGENGTYLGAAALGSNRIHRFSSPLNRRRPASVSAGATKTVGTMRSNSEAISELPVGEPSPSSLGWWKQP